MGSIRRDRRIAMEDVSHNLKELVAEHFSGYEFPYETADVEINGLRKDEKDDYFADAKRIVESRVWRTELKGMLRHYFSILAFKSSAEKTWSEQDAYRLTVLMLQDLDKRLHQLSALSGMSIIKIGEQLYPQKKVDET